LACKYLYLIHKANGIEGLKNLNGNYVIFVFDANLEKFYIINDRCGMFPCFWTKLNVNELVFASHPDILAKFVDFSDDWDLTSMAEFIITGKVTFPNTYHNKIKASDYGAIHTMNLYGEKIFQESSKKYFEFDFHIDEKFDVENLAEELSTAFFNAVNKRAYSFLGPTAISLSGGLDSRTILCSANSKDELSAFCFYDEENLEYNIAKQVAITTGVNFIPLKRNFEYYGENAYLGVKISGGTGNIFNNHYLGMRKNFKNLGFDNILAGFYADRLFKGYVLDKKRNKILGTQRLFKFNYQANQPIYWFRTIYSNLVQERLDTLFPAKLKNDVSSIAKLIIENKRIFPLYSESENPTTIIPQRILGWYLPTIDNDIIDIYLKTPVEYKLDGRLYLKVVETVCGKMVSKIINANTGAKIKASRLTLIINYYKNALRRKLIPKGIKTNESWPNWQYYICNSKKIKELWDEKNNVAVDIFKQIMGTQAYKPNILNYSKDELTLFMRLFTLKLWLDIYK